ncbi:MAG: LysR family transcriptional regulator [Methylocystis sp.]|nr:LysR family transcriptional regulator [Methylocystis sp.]MCA3583102.1 LysR family transcriptional regulator [Methylocystis sp.]MCA3588393.1 LysR family transcriptional regulator [Methylocystis sp.]MCA3593251.1 LysR family transcriptional regulator [Methylocystis sp.]
MDRLAELDIFARVVTAGSMSAAGRELGLSPPVVSKRIKNLEERLGTRLLQRTTRQLTLTESGKGFYERVVAILASVDEAEAWVSRRTAAARGTLRVSAPTSFGRMHIAPHLVEFLRLYPEITIDLSLSDAFVDIVAEGYDLAIRIADLADSSLVAKRLAPNHRVLCAAPGYLAAHGAPLSLADLAQHRLLLHNADQWRLEGKCGSATVRVESAVRTNSSEVIREAVLAGMGIALRSTWDVGPEIDSGRLAIVLPEWQASARVAVHAVYPSRRHLAHKVRVFMDFLGERFGNPPYWDKGLTLSAPANRS